MRVDSCLCASAALNRPALGPEPGTVWDLLPTNAMYKTKMNSDSMTITARDTKKVPFTIILIWLNLLDEQFVRNRSSC